MLESSELPPFLSDEFKALLLQNSVNAITARVNYDKFDIDLIQEESTGTQKLFANFVSHNRYYDERQGAYL